MNTTYRDRRRARDLGCWFCGEVCDAASLWQGSGPPDADSVAVCAYCGALAMFTGDGLTKRRLTPAEFEEISGYPDIQRMQATIRLRNAGLLR